MERKQQQQGKPIAQADPPHAQAIQGSLAAPAQQPPEARRGQQTPTTQPEQFLHQSPHPQQGPSIQGRRQQLTGHLSLNLHPTHGPRT